MFLLLEHWRIGLPPCIEFDAEEAGVSFAEHPRKPSFSLGLQGLLKVLLHKIRVPRVSQRVYELTASSQQQLDKAIVDRMHAVLSADLNQSRYLRKPPGPDTRLDSRVHRQQFRGQNQA